MKRMLSQVMSIKGLIFDFDGLIIDTETPEFEAWQEVFVRNGQHLPLSEWKKALGTSRLAFDPPTYLEELIGHPINKKKADHDQRVIALAKILQKSTLPGVEKILAEAKKYGLKLAVASSSSSDWVWCNLSRLGLLKYFDTICSGDDVPAVKPDPALFELAIAELGLKPEEAIVFEDSPNGITAANKAGIFCVAIPNKISGQLSVKHANLILNSLENISLIDLINAPAQMHQER
jgi:HAD superfamily hydrolase (TIGR01509 family)